MYYILYNLFAYKLHAPILIIILGISVISEHEINLTQHVGYVFRKEREDQQNGIGLKTFVKLPGRPIFLNLILSLLGIV